MSQYSVSPVALNAPGLPFSPVIQEDPEFVALLTAFGLAGQAASQIGQMGAQQRRDREELDNRIADVDRATWSRAAGQDLAAFRMGIDNGTIKLPAGADPGQFAEHLVGSHLDTMGRVSDAGREAYMQAAPRVADALARQASIDTAKDKNDLADALSNQAFLGNDPAAAVQTAMGAGFDEVTAYSKVIVPAMKTAAQLGDSEKFNSLAATLPEGQFTQEVAIAQRHLVAAQANRAAQEQDAYKAGFQALANDNAPTSQMRQELEQVKPRLTPAVYDQINDSIAAIEKTRDLESKAIGLDAAYGAVLRGGDLEDGDKIIAAMGLGARETVEAQNHLRSAFAERVRAENAAKEASARQGIYIEALTGAQSGVPLATVQDREFTVGGKSYTVTRNEQIEEATKIALGRLSQGKTPDQARAAMIDWAAGQGVHPRQFSDILEAAPSLAAQVADGKPVPQPLTNAIAFWAQAKQRGGAWTDGLADEKSRAFLDAAAINMQDSALSQAQAIAMASKAATATKEDHEAVSRRLTPTVLAKVEKSLPSDIRGALNSDSAMASITRRARSLMLGTNASGSALERVTADYKASAIMLGKYVSPTNQAGMTPGLREKLPDISTELSKEYAKRTETNAGDKALVWNPLRGTWQINDWMGHALTGPGAEFTTEQLARIASMKDEDAANTELANVVKAVNSRQAKRISTPYPLSEAIKGEGPIVKYPKPAGPVTGTSE